MVLPLLGMAVALAATGIATPVRAVLSISGYSTHQGIDSCHVPTNSQLSEMWSGTPFYHWGFYLGGNTAEYYGCVNWTNTKLQTAMDIGWGFTPIWDGKQAPAGCGHSYPTE
jgi:hypothetical protein